jgi:hypothetical protein
LTCCSWGGRLFWRTRRRGIGMTPFTQSDTARCRRGGGESNILLNGIAGASPLMVSQHLRDQTAGRAASTTVSMAFTPDSAAQAYHSWGCAREVTSRWVAMQWHKGLLANSVCEPVRQIARTPPHRVRAIFQRRARTNTFQISVSSAPTNDERRTTNVVAWPFVLGPWSLVIGPSRSYLKGIGARTTSPEGSGGTQHGSKTG